MSASNNNNIENGSETNENIENIETNEEPVKNPNHRLNMDLDILDNDGNTALALACKNGYEEIIEILCSTKNPKIGINVPNKEGNTPLLLVCAKDCRKSVECLIKRGANRHHVNNNGENALMIACKNGHINVVEELIKDPQIDDDIEEEINENDLDVNDLDKNDNSALSLAVRENHVFVVKYLMDNFGKILTEHVIRQAYREAEEKGFQDVMKIIPYQCYSKPARSAQ